ncbi:cation transporter [Longimonas halophila]|jgi:Co/Zn/Cd efflux system component|uniref:Cation transporter n=1 Tax=Longimonas halophila TaxID=1469170 RepID=A0A2H3P1K4_9BACT|nr:cation transporter [Longimonas halophila]PEN04701.1 cation transporter [Longimonas halophila]
MKKTVFEVRQMDCQAEENLIRMKLDELSGIKNLEFDLPNRRLAVYHSGKSDPIERCITALNLGEKKLYTNQVSSKVFSEKKDQKKLLWLVLAINFLFFLIEITFGFISESMGLIADSLDMLADSFVYGISLLAVGSTLARKKRIAKIAGYFQITLAVIGFVEVIRRFFGTVELPNFSTMIIVATLALIANVFCLYLLQQSNNKKEAHMKASMIFTSNDIIINLGVISAGFLVNWLNSNMPDLIIGSIVFIVVIQGAIRILKVGK